MIIYCIYYVIIANTLYKLLIKKKIYDIRNNEIKTKGRITIRKQRYFYKSHDLVKFETKIHSVVGVQNNGVYTKLKNCKNVIKECLIKPYKFNKGFAILEEKEELVL